MCLACDPQEAYGARGAGWRGCEVRSAPENLREEPGSAGAPLYLPLPGGTERAPSEHFSHPSLKTSAVPG